MLKVDKNWTDAHFGSQPAAKRIAEQKPRGLVGLAIKTAALLLGVAVLGIGGFAAARLIDTQPAPMPTARAAVPTPAPAPFVRRVNLQPAMMPAAQPIAAPVVAPEPAAPAVIAGPDRRQVERAAHLRAGIETMSKDKAILAAEAQVAGLALIVRPRPSIGRRPAPWSAAESLDEIAIYLRENPRIGTIEAMDLQRHRDAAMADCTNARRRLAELADQTASLEHRIAKAQAEADQLAP